MKRLLAIGLLLGGCTLYESRGDDDDPTAGPPPGDSGSGGGSGSGPEGKQFLLARAQVGGIPCGFVEEEFARTIGIEGGQVFVDGVQAVVRSFRSNAAREDRSDPPNVVFTHDEVWQSAGTVFPIIDTSLWIDGTTITGDASTAFDGCSYTWRVTGS